MVTGKEGEGEGEWWLAGGQMGGSRGTETGIVVGLRTLKRAFVKQASN